MKHDCFCTIHRVWYAKDCKQCIVDAWADATVVHIEGEPRTPRDAIRRARRVSGLSQNKLVREAGMARAQICKWETGKTSPRLDLFLRTMAACGYRVIVERGPNLALRGARPVELEAAQPVPTTSA